MRYDVIIIGFGKAGKTLAAKMAAEGKAVAMIEKDEKMYGGTCINVGCIPSKSLVTSSQEASGHVQRSFEEKAEFYRGAIQEKRRVTTMLRQKNFDKLDHLENVTVINGEASFLDAHRISVTKKEETLELEAEKIIINTGSTPVILPIPGTENNPYVYTSAQLMDLDELPKRLIIIGGGYIGLEFASMYSGFGSEITILQDGGQLIAREDRDIAQTIQENLESKGVRFLLGVKIQKVESAGAKVKVSYLDNEKAEVLEAEAVLLATGRRPNTDHLALDKAGVEMTKRGAVVVDDFLKTSVEHIWAAGDVNGGQQFTYVSLDDSRIIWSQLHGGDYEKRRRKAVPYSVFLSPTYSRVGLNEKEALDQGYDFRVAKMPAAAIPKAQVLRRTEGMLKALIDNKTDKILGVMLFCEESHEMINIVKLAMDFGVTYQVLRDQVFTHPTMSEALNDLFSM